MLIKKIQITICILRKYINEKQFVENKYKIKILKKNFFIAQLFNGSTRQSKIGY